MTNKFNVDKIKAFFIDIDGTLNFRGKIISGAVEAVEYLKNKNYAVRFITNTTNKSCKQRYSEHRSYGFKIKLDEIVTPVLTCNRYFEKKSSTRAYTLMNKDVIENIPACRFDDQNPNYVAVGNFGDKFCYDVLNNAFNFIKDSASLCALQTNPFWFDKSNRMLDCGAFAAAL